MVTKTENKQTKVESVLNELMIARKLDKFNKFVQKKDGSELVRVCNEMELSNEFLTEYTYNSRDKNELIGFILAGVKGKEVLNNVETESQKALEKETN